ncbi:mediator of RNA polymerase II transcription subunit 5 [Dichotomopilus funicola]|uniref:Mediator of RNA polymerase II transcription subunit 5 n=1 Tax=Dichotomopilus funicola TaxID=1934379 RepID=A0AAN6V947_9PEZI|nr:mediator of RNA polymerase II transcription subunit 5 [Dichotomopilus funicola]
MDPHHAHAHNTLTTSLTAWQHFLDRALLNRLDPARFAAFLPIHFSAHPLPPALVADVLLRPPPAPRGCYRLDPRVLLYLQALLRQRWVDVAGVLRGLFVYSSAQRRVGGEEGEEGDNGEGAGEGGGISGDGGDVDVKMEVEEEGGGIQAGVEAHNKNDTGKKNTTTTKRPRKPRRWQNSYDDEEVILWRLARAIHEGTAVKTAREVAQVAQVLAAWMRLFAARDVFGPSAMHHHPAALMQARDDMEDARAAFVLLLIAFSESPTVLAALERVAFRGVCKWLSEALRVFVPCIMQGLPAMATRLEIFRTDVLGKHLPRKKKDVEDVDSYVDSFIDMDSFQVPELPVVNSRAGLYIYLSAALVGRPMLDDTALFTYLHNRYQGDIQSTAVQLILASFDLLANAVFRNEGPKTGHLLKSYVVNKVPLILVSLARTANMYPFDPESCIKEALGQVDTNVFPTLSGMFEMTTNNAHHNNANSSFHDSVRQDFCFSCQLHGLLSQQAIESLLGDITYQSLPDEGRYVKESLVQACLQDVDRTQKLIGELDNMNGNVGAAAQAIIEVIGSLCRNKETMTLKQLCSQLAAKPLSLDVLLLFDKPQKILQPLCELLDNWAGYEEDQGEYQPVYEEFGSILLLLLAFVYRYNLSPADLGLRSPDLFLAKLLGGGNKYRPLEELDEQEKAHLNGWIHGLFDTAGGLGDDLMASCPPQDFYLLIPTLFQQIVVALSAGYLADDVLKGGLEYLVGVLLLPSLVPAILYLSNQLWVGGPQMQSAIIKILQVIIRPSGISNEAMTMLSSVLNIVAKPLEHALRSYQRQDPKCQEIEPLLRAIQENLALSRRTGGADHTELESWCSTHANSSSTSNATNNNNTLTNSSNNNTTNNNNNGASGTTTTYPHSGLTAAVRHTVQSLIQWAQHPPSLNGTPATYTHRQTLAAVKMLGAKRVLAVLLDELRAAADTPQASIAYDVATALICAPDVTNDASLPPPPSPTDPNTSNPTGTNPDGTTTTAQQQQQKSQHPSNIQRRTTLRTALHLKATTWKQTQTQTQQKSGSNDPLTAETIVRLHRRVEAQLTPAPPPLALAAIAINAAAAMLHGHGQPVGVELAGALGSGDVLGDAMGGSATGDLLQDSMVLDAAAAAAGLDGTDLLGGSAGDLGSNSGAGGTELGGDGLFGSLGAGSDFGADFGGWDMDLS